MVRTRALQVSGAVLAMVLGGVVPPDLAAAQDQPANPIESGKAIAMDRTKGNCTACHQVPGVEFHGDIAPPLVAIKERFPDRARLRAQIHDATAFNPTSVMPPFGKHRILTEAELDHVVAWLLTL